jgi:hypothetical protein
MTFYIIERNPKIPRENYVPFTTLYPFKLHQIYHSLFHTVRERVCNWNEHNSINVLETLFRSVYKHTLRKHLYHEHIHKQACVRLYHHYQTVRMLRNPQNLPQPQYHTCGFAQLFRQQNSSKMTPLSILGNPTPNSRCRKVLPCSICSRFSKDKGAPRHSSSPLQITIYAL